MNNNVGQAGLVNNNLKGEVKISDKMNNNFNFGGKTTNNNLTINLPTNLFLSQEQIVNLQNSLNIANSAINANQQKFVESVKEILEKETINPEQILEDIQNPENCKLGYDIYKIVALINNRYIQKCLAELVCKKIGVKDDFKNITYNRAIKAMEFITENQLKILSLLYILQSSLMDTREISNWEEFNLFFKEYFVPLLNINSKHITLEYEDLFTNGCLTTDLLNIIPKKQYFRNIIRNFITREIPYNEIGDLGIREDYLYSLGFYKTNDNMYYIFNDNELDNSLYKNLDKYKISKENKDKLSKLYVEYGYDSNSLICNHTENFDKLLNILESIKDTRFKFTPVGLVIVKEFLKIKLKLNLKNIFD